MTPIELRALAETLEHECALRLIAGGKNHEEAQACEQAADYLRQCAEQPPPGWQFVPVVPTREMLRAVDDEAEDKYLARGRAVSAWQAMLEAAPVPPAHRCCSSETPSSKATSAASPERPALNREDAAAQVAASSGEQRS